MYLFLTELDWTLFPSAVIGHKGISETYAIDGMIDGMFRSDKNNYKWIEITLPDFILVPQVKFFSGAKYFGVFVPSFPQNQRKIYHFYSVSFAQFVYC